MNPEGATPTSLGFGVERHIEKSRSASEPKEKVEHLTCAIEALLLHVSSLEGEARAGRVVPSRSRAGCRSRTSMPRMTGRLQCLSAGGRPTRITAAMHQGSGCARSGGSP